MVFQANLTVLIQLYIIGVFVSFTLGQTGMVRHWLRELSLRRHPAGKAKRPRRAGATNAALAGAIVRALVINAIGAGMTAVVLIVVTITKFTHGAWIVFVMMPILFFLMMGVNRYYRDVEKEIEVDPTTTFGATGDHAIVLVGRMQKPTLKALDYAIAARHDSLEAVHVSIDDEHDEAPQEGLGASRTSTCSCASCRRRTATSATRSSSTSRPAARSTAPRS